jgi:hypothetical protein
MNSGSGAFLELWICRHGICIITEHLSSRADCVGRILIPTRQVKHKIIGHGPSLGTTPAASGIRFHSPRLIPIPAIVAGKCLSSLLLVIAPMSWS